MENLKFGKTAILFLLLTNLVFSGCSFFNSFSDDNDNGIQITSLVLAKPSVSISVGEMSYVSITVKPTEEQKNIKLNWSYDKAIVSCDASSPWGVTVKGLKEGQTNLK